MNRTLVALSGIAALVIVAYLGFELLAPTVNRCEGIFQQTAPSLTANVKFLEAEGGLALGRSQIQELSDRAQEVGLNLEACCIMVGSGPDSVGRFNECKAATATYDTQVAEAVATIKALAAASETARAARLDDAEARLATIMQTAGAAASSLATQVEEIRQSEAAPAGTAPAPDAANAAPGQFRARAALTGGGEAVAACFRVYAPEQDLQGNRSQIDYACSDNAVFTLPAGAYVVTATAGDATVQSDIAVASGQVTDHIFDLDAGYLRMRATLIAGGDPIEACFWVYEPDEDLQGNRRQVNYACGDNAVFTLPAGDYVVAITAGDATRQAAPAVVAGQLTDEIAALDAGHLRVRAALIDSGEAIEACFWVYEPEQDLQGNRRQVNYACGDNAVFTLLAGDYVVIVTAGDATRQAELAVQAGMVTDRFIALDAGFLRLRATAADGGDPVSACFYVYQPDEELQGNRRQVNYACTDNAVFTLPAGSYFVHAESGETSASEIIEVQAGAATDRRLTLGRPP